jgi:hypothetical protein
LAPQYNGGSVPFFVFFISPLLVHLTEGWQHKFFPEYIVIAMAV